MQQSDKILRASRQQRSEDLFLHALGHLISVDECPGLYTVVTESDSGPIVICGNDYWVVSSNFNKIMACI